MYESTLPYTEALLARASVEISNRFRPSRADVLAVAREVFGTKRLVRPDQVLKDLTEHARRISQVREERAEAAEPPPVSPIVKRWPEQRLALIRSRIEKAITAHYQGPSSRQGGWSIIVKTSDTVSARGERKAGFFSPYRPGHRNYPDYHDWVWQLTVRERWLTDVERRLGTCVVDGVVILDVLADNGANQRRTVDVLWLKQSRGNSIDASKGTLYRESPDRPWWLRPTGAITRAWIHKRELQLVGEVMSE